jgi:hypothetical protein
MVGVDIIASTYQEVLRAVGRFVDQHGLTNVRLAETDGGFVLQGTVPGNGDGQKSQADVFFLTAQEIRDVMLWS